MLSSLSKLHYCLSDLCKFEEKGAFGWKIAWRFFADFMREVDTTELLQLTTVASGRQTDQILCLTPPNKSKVFIYYIPSEQFSYLAPKVYLPCFHLVHNSSAVYSDDTLTGAGVTLRVTAIYSVGFYSLSKNMGRTGR